jgi:gliding motility-associated protein GldM
MAGGKETPRQRMIGILYLVLLGLVALNVPESLMDAFRNITNSLDQSRTNVNSSLQTTYSAFEATKLKEQPDKAKQLLDRAREASKVSDDLNAYIEDLKKQLIDAGGGINPDIQDVNARESVDISPNIMINDGKAAQLKQKIEETKSKLIQILGKDTVGVKFSLSTDSPSPSGIDHKTWEEAYFGDGTPLGAALTTLAKIQADDKNAENEVVKKILGKIDQAQVTLNTFQAVAVAPSSYILAGQKYTAQIYLTAFDKNSNPTITVGGSPVPTANGVGTYTATASGEGLHTWTGQLSVKQVDGPPKSYPITGSYMVAKPSAVVSPDKMNVLYIGVANPLSVSAPGVPVEQLKVSITGGSISGSRGHYTATVNQIGTAKVTITGDKGMTLGSSEFRIKRIPDPKAVFAGKSGGSTSAANLRAQDKLFARLENFDFDTHFDVTRFTMYILKPRQDAVIYSAQGSDLTGQMKSAMASLSPGSKVIFSNIVATGPGGTRGLDDIILSAN